MIDARPALAGGRRSPLRRLLGSAAVQMTVLYGTTGALYAVASLALARALSVADYAAVTLVLALIGLGGLLGPLGQERVVVRRRLAATPGLLARGLAAAAAVGLAVAGGSALVYGLDQTVCALIVLAVAAQGTAIVASARLQSEQRLVLASLITQAASPILFVVALLAIGLGLDGTLRVTALYAAGLVLVSAASWSRLFAEAAVPNPPPYRIDWSETLALTGFSGMAALSATLDRLVIPLALGTADLAQFGVLAAVVIGPMRVLQVAAQRSLTPRLRDAATAAARRRMLLHEALIMGALTGVACLGLWFVVPPVAALLVGDKYELPPPLLLAGLAGGAARVVGGFAMAAITALSPRERLHLVNASGWLALSLALPAAWLGARWGGLAGLVAAMAAVWALQAGVLFLLVAGRFRGP